MHSPPDSFDIDVDRERDLQPYHVVYLVKRPAYQFIFAIPKTPPPFSGGSEAFCQIQFHPQRNPQKVILKMDELQNFYDSLGRLMDYVQIERQRRQHQQ